MRETRQVIVLGAAAITFVSTMVGGLFALRATSRLGLIIAFGAGVRIGAAFFDLAPESARALADDVETAMLFAAIGFIAFYLLERLTLLHVGHEAGIVVERHEEVGVLGAGGMSVHSFLDGIAIGAAFHAGTQLGVLIALVVIAHDFADGIATVSVLLANNARRSIALRWLVVDALAPVAGALAATAVTIEGPVLGALLGGFVGFFLYIGAAELLPEAHRKGRSGYVIVATLLGVAFIYAATKFLAI